MGKAKRTLSVIMAALMLVFTCMTYVPASAAEVTTSAPVVDFVGVDHSPLVVGDTESFSFVTKNADSVQYKAIVKDAKGNVVDDLTKGYSAAVPGSVPFEVKGTYAYALGKYTLTVYAKRVSDSKEVSYDAALNCVTKDNNNRIYANDDMILDKTTVAVGEKLTIGGVKNLGGIVGPYKFRLHIYNASTNTWTKNVVASFGDKIEWTPTEAGTYVLDVHINSEKSTTWAKYLANPTSQDLYGTYEAWKLKTITVTPAAPVALAVSNVTALNLNQIKVEFNKAVDSTSAKNVNNYKLNDAVLHATSKIALASDAKSVTITLDTQDELGGVPTQGTKKVLTVENVLAENSYTEVAAKVSKEITFFDNTAPTVVSVTPSGNTVLSVKLSEAVRSLNLDANFKIDGLSISAYAGSAAFSTTNKVADNGTDYYHVVTITFGAALPAGSHKLSIGDVTSNYIMDMAGFVVAPVVMPFDIANDTASVQAVSATGSTNGDVTVTFNKDILSTSVANAFKVNGSGLLTGVVNPANKKEVALTLPAGVVKEGDNLIYVLNSVTDLYGNQVNAKYPTQWTQFAFKATKDSVAPSVNGITVVDDKTLKVTFSEIVNTLFASNVSNYKITDAAGNRYVPTGISVDTDSDGVKTVVTLTYTTALPGATYTIKVSNVQDVAGNVMAADTKTFVSPDKTGPDASLVTMERYTTGNKVIVKYNEPMDASASTIANYYYNTGSGYVVFPGSTNVEVTNNNTTFTFTLPIGYVNVTAINQVRATNVKDASGNLISGGMVEKTLTNASAATFEVVNTSLDYPKAYMSGNKLVVEFNTENDIATYIPTNFAVRSANGVLNVTPNQILVAGKNVKLLFSTNIAAIKSYGTDIILTANAVTDGFGRTLSVPLYTDAANRITIDDGMTPELVAVNALTVPARNQVKLQFNETLDSSIVGAFKDAFTVAVNGAPKTVTSTTIATTAVTNDTIVFNLYSNYADNGTVVSVLPAATSTVKDMNGNVYAPVLPDDNLSLTVAGLAIGVTANAVATTPGHALVPATPATGTINIATMAATDTVSVDGTTFTMVAAAPAAGQFTNEAELVGLIDALPNVSATGDGAGLITVTAATAGTAGNSIALAKAENAGTITLSGSTLANGTAIVPAVTESAAVTVATGASSTGNITVTINGTAHTVAVAAGDSAVNVAAKIAAQLTTDANLTGWTFVAPTTATITFTSTTVGANVADLTFVVAAN